MLFSKNFFVQNGFAEDEAKFIAELVNSTIDENSTVLYGQVFEGSPLVFEKFSTKQKKHDNYKALVILADELGIFDNKQPAKLKIDRPDQNDNKSIFQKRNQQLKRDVRRLSNKEE